MSSTGMARELVMENHMANLILYPNDNQANRADMATKAWFRNIEIRNLFGQREKANQTRRKYK